MSAYTEIESWLSSKGYDLQDYNLPAQGQIIYEYCKETNIQVSQFRDNRKTLYKQRGYKVKDALIAHKESTDSEIYMSYVNLGDLPLKSPETVKLAKKLESKIVQKDAPRRVKLEHGLTRNNLVHCHFIFSGSAPPETVTINGKDHTVNTVIIGQVERWKDYSYDEQLKRAVTYLYKPGNITGTEGHNKIDLKHQAYLEWFLEQQELHKLTPRQRKKLSVRTAWNKNIKVKL